MNTENNELHYADELSSTREILREVYNAMSEKGYNPIGQIVGYLLSEDPTYITNYNNARSLIRKIDRDELMAELVKNYLELN
ncbi:MAG: IreB family regulatory phosphoprotein [Clostridia bacterium]|nr:IreB family regulatory phosphoprotein [Clostridia bacterium]